jgi:tripartite-type tricarboxylate transporter receptor subunit TctC
MHIIRRFFILLILSFSATLSAQETKPARIIVPFPAGGATDALARLLAIKLGSELGQNFIVENKPGASGQIGTAFVKSSAPDGNTWLFTPDHTIVTLPRLVQKAGYEPLDDFVAAGLVARFPLALSVAPNTGVKSLQELTQFVRSQPGQGSYGVPVVGGFPSTVGVALSQRIGVPLVAVPFPGSGPALQQVAANQIMASITGLADAMPLAKAGRVKVVAVTGEKRSPFLADVPTFQELGISSLSIDSWYGFFAPKATAPAMIERFNHVLVKVLNESDVKQRIADFYIEQTPATLPEAQAEFRTATQFWLEASKSPSFIRP